MLSMHARRVVCTAALLCLLTQFERSASRILLKYKLDATWPLEPSKFVASAQDFCTAVDDVSQEVYVGLRGPGIPLSGPVLVFGEDGTYHRSWGHNVVDMIHGMRLQRLANGTARIWVTDLGNGAMGHTVKMFSTDGDLLETIGTPGKAGVSLNPIQFDQVADIAIDQSDSLYIVDGDGGMNNRLVKLDANRNLAWSVGVRGSKPSQFYIPHSVEFDPNLGMVWVADRGNNRTQAFNASDGSFITEWTCMRPKSPCHIRLDPSGHNFIMLDLLYANIFVIPAPKDVQSVNSCHVVRQTAMYPNNTKPHAFSISKTTWALYIGEVGANVTQKYVPYSGLSRDKHSAMFTTVTVFEPFLLCLLFVALLLWVVRRRLRSGGKPHNQRVGLIGETIWHK